MIYSTDFGRVRMPLALSLFVFLFSKTLYTRHDGKRNLLVESGTFQKVPVVYINEFPRDSTVHCIGGTFGENHDQDWLFRSCEFRDLCFDLDMQEFVLFPSKEEQELMELLNKNSLVSVSTVSSPGFQMALGAVDPPEVHQDDDEKRTDEQEKNVLSWYPLLRNEKETKGYYELPDSHILVPFQESYPLTPKSLVDKDYFSLFTLLFQFGFETKNPIFVRHGKTLPACDKDCEDMLKMHLHLTASTPALSGIDRRASNLVCSKYGVAGLGVLMTGTGPKRAKDGSWVHTHTIGRHSAKRAFQDYMKRAVAA